MSDRGFGISGFEYSVSGTTMLVSQSVS